VVYDRDRFAFDLRIGKWPGTGGAVPGHCFHLTLLAGIGFIRVGRWFGAGVARAIRAIRQSISTSCALAAQESKSSCMIAADFVQPDLSVSIPVKLLK
jgi:hypothetical protein